MNFFQVAGMSEHSSPVAWRSENYQKNQHQIINSEKVVISCSACPGKHAGTEAKTMSDHPSQSLLTTVRSSRVCAVAMASVLLLSQVAYGAGIGMLKLPLMPVVPEPAPAMVGVPVVKNEPSSEPYRMPTLGNLVALALAPYTACARTETTQSLPESNTPVQGSGAGGPMSLPKVGSFGPTAGDPVNLTNGQEEYRPGADITVYNPTGPSVVWRRMYYSMTNWDSAFGVGWSHPYNVAVLPPNGSTHGAVVYANNSRVGFTASSVPNSTTTDVACTLDTNGNGIDVHWKYDAAGNYFVVSFKDHSSYETVKTSSDSYLRPAKWFDKSGNSIQFNYSDYTPGTGYAVRPRLTSIADSSSTALVTFTLDSNGNIQQAYDRYSRSVYYSVTSHAYTDTSLTPNFSYELDQASIIVATGTSSPMARHTYTYANYNNSSSQAVPYVHTIAVPDPDGSGTATSTIEYDSLGKVSSIVDSNGNKSVFTYGSGYTQVDLKDPSNNTVYMYIANYTGSSVMSVQDQNLDFVVSYAYSDTDCPTKPSSITQKYSVTPYLARTTTFDYDTHGNLLSTVAPSGLTTTYTYSTPTGCPLGELDSIQQSKGSSTLLPTWLYYDSHFRVNQVKTAVPGQSTGTSTQSTYITYTSLGNVATVTSPGNNDTSVHTTTYGYTSDTTWGPYSQSEKLGQPITVTDTLGHVSHLRYDSRGNVTNSADPLLNETTFAYNLADQGTTTTLPEASSGAGHATQTVTYLYTGGPSTKTEAFGPSGGSALRTVNVTYGHEGELLTQTGSCEEVSYTYDPVYRLKTLSDGNSHATTYKYDTLGHLEKVEMPGTTGTNFDQTKFTSFDLQGNCLSRTDGNGVVTNYEYGTSSSDDGLLSTVSYPATSQSITLTRDNFDRTTSVTDLVGTETYSLDYLGNVTSKATTYTSVPTQTFDYTFYPDGSRNTMVNSAGTWTYYYDSDGRCRRMDSPADVGSTHFTSTYFDNGLQDRRTVPNGFYTDNTYNHLGLPTSIINKNASGTVKSQFDTFTYDGVFNLTGSTTSNSTPSSYNGTISYSYDTKDRVTQESSSRIFSGGYTDNYAYDNAGNPTTWPTSISKTYNSDNQQTGTGFAYDGNGNPTTYAGSTMTYDQESRLASAVVGSNTVKNEYRADGLRSYKEVYVSTYTGASRTGTYYYYDRGNAVLEATFGGAVTAVNVHAPDGLVARKESSWKYYQFDQQGNVVSRSNSSGTVSSVSAYNAYGLNYTAPSTPDCFRGNGRWGYYYDADLTLTLCQHRFYDPGAGRWINRDPISYDGGMNLYGYCESGPIGSTDPTGLRPGWKAVLEYTLELNSMYNGGIVNQIIGAIGGIGGEWNSVDPDGLIRVRGGLFAGAIGPEDSMTIGNIVNTGKDVTKDRFYHEAATLQPDHTVNQHEFGHVIEHKMFGVLYLPLYALGAGIGAIRGDKYGKNPMEEHSSDLYDLIKGN